MGRPALEESKRIMFMTKKVDHSDDPKAPAKGGRLFEFVLEANVPGEKLLDSYCGVEFSILYKIYASFMIKHN